MQVWFGSSHGLPEKPPHGSPSTDIDFAATWRVASARGLSSVTQIPGQSARGSQPGLAGSGMQVCPVAHSGRPRLPQAVRDVCF